MGGRLERDAPVTGVEHLPEKALEVDRLRRRERRRARDAADDPLHRPDETGSAACRGEHRAQEVRRRRLAVGAGDARDLELARRLAEEEVCRDGHRHPDVVDDELGSDDIDYPLDDERNRAALDRLGGERVTVDMRARNAEERGARTHRARVVCEVADVDRPDSGHLARGERPDQGLELHLHAKARRTSGGRDRPDHRPGFAA